MALSKSFDTTREAESSKAPKAEARSPRRLPTTPKPAVATELGALLDGPNASFRDDLRSFLNNPELFPHPELSLEQQREHTFNNLTKVRDFGGFTYGLRRAHGGEGKPNLATFTLEGLAWVDGSPVSYTHLTLPTNREV